MKTTVETYYCDRCKKEVRSYKDLRNLYRRSVSGVWGCGHALTAELCSKCDDDFQKFMQMEGE